MKNKDHLYKPGQSGNEKGRPKGSRNKFTEHVLKAFLSDFDIHGAAAIVAVREKSQLDYCKLVVALANKMQIMKADETDTERQVERVQSLMEDRILHLVSDIKAA